MPSPFLCVVYNSLALALPRLLCSVQCVRVTVLHRAAQTLVALVLCWHQGQSCVALLEKEWELVAGGRARLLCLCAGHMVQAQV